MAKIKAPLFSLDATGTLDKNITYKGKLRDQIAQKYSKPGDKNPFESSPRQKDQRSIIRLITIHWQCMSSADKLSWENAAKDARFKGAGYHYFLSKAQQNLTQYLGLVGYWSMNYNVNDKIPDLSGNGNHGTLSPIYPCDCPTLVDSFDKKHGKAAKFDGIDDFIECGSASIFVITDEITIEATICPILPYPTSWPSVVTSSLGNDRPEFVGYSAGDYRLRFTGSMLDGTSFNLSTPNLISNTSYNLIGTYDGASIRFYLDGILTGSIAITGPLKTPLGSLQFGARSGTNPFMGKVDNILIFNVGLSEEEVKKHSQF